MSTKTGLAPTDLTEFAVATKVNDGTSTSSPGFMSIAYRDAWSAAVPELTATANFDLTNFDNSFSNCWTRFPPSNDDEVNDFSDKTVVTSRISSLPMSGIFIEIFN